MRLNFGVLIFTLTTAFAALPNAGVSQTLRNRYLVPSEGGLRAGQKLPMLLVNADRTSRFMRIPGGLLPFANVHWSSSNPSVATVDAAGIVLARANGTAIINATIPSVRGFPQQTLRSRITVGTTRVRLVGPPSTSLARYCTAPVSISSVTAAGTPLDYGAVTWNSDTPGTASVEPIVPRYNDIGAIVSGTGDVQNTLDALYYRRIARIRGIAPGQATVTVSGRQTTTQITVNVNPGDPSEVRIAPASMELDVQETGQATATVWNASGCLVPNAGITWSVLEPTIASVDVNTGLVRGLRSGATQLTAAVQGGVTASIPITVPSVSGVSISPGSGGELDFGEARSFSVVIRSTSGRTLQHRAVTWVASGSAVSISPISGYSTTVTGRSVGTATVTATSEGVSDAITVTVPQVGTVTVDPGSATIPIAGTRTLRAIVAAFSGKPLNGRNVQWAASNNLIRLSTTSGYTTIVTGVTAGTSTVTAASEGVTSSPASIHVTTYCEVNLCFPQYVVNNYKGYSVDVFVVQGYQWAKVTTVPANTYWYSSPTSENNIYYIRVVPTGSDPTILNGVLNESYFIGGPGQLIFSIDVI